LKSPKREPGSHIYHPVRFRKEQWCLFLLSVTLWSLAGGCGGRQSERVLFDFESEAELNYLHWKCHALLSLSPEHATHGKQSLRMELFPDEYSGFAPMIENTDWRGYETFCFDIYNRQGRPVPLTVRIDDKKDYPDYDDRYNKTFVLKPGLNTVSIPLCSLMTSGTRGNLNLGTIYRVIVFLVRPEERTVLNFDYFRVTNHNPRKQSRSGKTGQ
jgi:hypothetical protein